MLKNLIIILTVLAIFCIFIVNSTPVKRSFGINRAKTSEKVMALTYDDGPSPIYTHQLLDIFDRYRAKATFFAIGKQIEKHPEVTKLVLARGHELANHSYSHQDLVLKSPKFIFSEIDKTDRLLHDLGILEEITFRPPWGRRFLVLPYLIFKLNKKLIMWEIDSKDYQEELSPEVIAQRIIERAKPGAIVVLHDGGGDRSRTVAATEIVLQTLKSKGYEFKTVSELLKGKKYS